MINDTKQELTKGISDEKKKVLSFKFSSPINFQRFE